MNSNLGFKKPKKHYITKNTPGAIMGICSWRVE